MKLIYSWCLLLLSIDEVLASTWSDWWNYEGISGPDFWGLLNTAEWSLCSRGKRQSPINIKPRDMLYDPNLKHLHVGKHRVSGTLINTGHDVRVILDDLDPLHVNVTGGPLQYQYRISDIIFHYGSDNSVGSEHSIDDTFFPAEIHFIGWNSEIYGNLTQAQYSSNGLIIIALLVQVGPNSNQQFQVIAQNLKLTKYKGQQVRIRHLSVHEMLPETSEYMTYEGSLTQPGCQETVTWIIYNKPIYATEEELKTMRMLMQGDETSPKNRMENNNRPTMPFHDRTIRTNINLQKPSKTCTMQKETHYHVNGLQWS